MFDRVCVLTGDHHLPDATKPGGTYAEQDLRYHETMRAALEGSGRYAFEFVTDHSRLIARLQEDAPQFVLNFCDTGFRNVATQELHVPALLEMLGVPYSGAPPACMAICYDKALVRMLAGACGVPVPGEAYIDAQDPLDGLAALDYPALIKPNRADGSVGITRDALVRDAVQARDYIEALRAQLPGVAALVQEYLPGAEYGIGLIGNPGVGMRVLPALTVDFSALPAGLAPILAYESKTDPDSPYWTRIRLAPAHLDGATLAQLGGWAERLFARLQCRDYARFDFRTAADGSIKLMEVNPNPAWDHEAKLALMAGFAGCSYADFLHLILDAAHARLAAQPA